MLSSPIRCIAAASWPSAGSASRSLSAPSSAASALCRHCPSLKSGRPNSRESSSADSPRISRSTTSRLRAALQRWPGASGPSVVRPPSGATPCPVDSADGLRPPPLTTGPSATSAPRLSFMLHFIMLVSSRTNRCPEKPGAAQEAWLVGEWRSSGERKYYLSNLPPRTSRRALASAIKARWVCEQAHQQLKQELGLGHFEGRSWTGLHRHALMTCIAFAYLQHLRLAAHRRARPGKNAAPRSRTAPIAKLACRAPRHHRPTVRALCPIRAMSALQTPVSAITQF